jgi:hypothetical protein
VTLNVVTCDPTFFKHDQPKGVWKKKLVWKDEWVKDHKTVKQVRNETCNQVQEFKRCRSNQNTFLSTFILLKKTLKRESFQV